MDFFIGDKGGWRRRLWVAHSFLYLYFYPSFFLALCEEIGRLEDAIVD